MICSSHGAIKIQVVVFWVMTSCSGGLRCLYLQGEETWFWRPQFQSSSWIFSSVFLLSNGYRERILRA